MGRTNNILKPIIINSKEILDNYKEIKLPVELLNSTYSYSPWFIVGFTEAEGNFYLIINTKPKILPKFRFRLSSKYLDIVLLCAIRNYFGSGSIFYRRETKVFILEISRQEVIENKILPLFYSYSLKGTKYFDYVNWRDGFKDFILNKELKSRISLIKDLAREKLILINLI